MGVAASVLNVRLARIDTALAWIAKGQWNHPTRAEEFLNATETLASKWNLKSEIFGL